MKDESNSFSYEYFIVYMMDSGIFVVCKASVAHGSYMVLVLPIYGCDGGHRDSPCNDRLHRITEVMPDTGVRLSTLLGSS